MKSEKQQTPRCSQDEERESYLKLTAVVREHRAHYI